MTCSLIVLFLIFDINFSFMFRVHTISSCVISDLFFCSKLSAMSLCSLTIFILDNQITMMNSQKGTVPHQINLQT